MGCIDAEGNWLPHGAFGGGGGSIFQYIYRERYVCCQFVRGKRGSTRADLEFLIGWANIMHKFITNLISFFTILKNVV